MKELSGGRGSAVGAVVTWQEAEDALLGAREYLAVGHDRERAYLRAGSRSCWPEIVRSRQDMDYAEGEGFGAAAPPPRTRLSQREIRHRDQYLGPDGVWCAISRRDLAVVELVLVAKLWPNPGGFRWRPIAEAIARRERPGELLSNDDLAKLGEAVRMRYSRAIGDVAKEMERRGLGPTATAQ